jgi:hypothetical protein
LSGIHLVARLCVKLALAAGGTNAAAAPVDPGLAAHGFHPMPITRHAAQPGDRSDPASCMPAAHSFAVR